MLYLGCGVGPCTKLKDLGQKTRGQLKKVLLEEADQRKNKQIFYLEEVHDDLSNLVEVATRRGWQQINCENSRLQTGWLATTS